jgi:hypothetical protein
VCLDCGCHRVMDDHQDDRHITLADLAGAADASGLPVGAAAANILSTIWWLLEVGPPAAVVDAPPDVEADADDVVKAGAEQRYVLGVAYQAGPDPLIAKGVDGGRDYFTETELEKAAWSFLRNGPQVGAFHLDGTEQNGGAATVVESYIYRGPDWNLGDVVVKSGDWLIGAILNDKAWQLHKAGKINGWSPQGTARRRRVIQPAT